MATPTFWNNQPQFSVDPTEGQDQWEPMITGLTDGRFIVTWTEEVVGSGVTSTRAQIYNADGSKKGGEIQLTSGGDTNQNQPTITALSDGNFVAVWKDAVAEAPQTADIYAQVYTIDGATVGTGFRVTTTTLDSQSNPTVTALSNGNYAVAWEDNSGTGGDIDGTAIRARIFSGAGPQTGELLVNTSTTDSQSDPSIAAIGGNEFVVTWTDQSGDGSGDNAIRMQVYNNDGSPVGAELVVNTTTTGTQINSKVTKLANGGFVVTWESNDVAEPDGTDLLEYDVRARVFDANGNPVGGEITVNTASAERQIESVVTALKDGRFLVTWSDYSNAAATSSDIKGQVFTAAGVKDGAEFLINNAGEDKHQLAPTVSTLVDGRVVIAWWSDTGDGTDSAVYTRILEPREAGILLAGTALNDDYIGTNFSDTLGGAGGADRLDAAGGNDTLSGGVGADTLIGGDGYDYVDFSSSLGGVTVNLATGIGVNSDAQGDLYSSIEGAIGSALSDTLSGNYQGNHLIGADGEDMLYGEAGADTLEGGSGADHLWGGAGGDTLNGGVGSDYVRYDHATAGVIVSLVGAGNFAGEAAGDVLTGIENLVGSDHADSLTGNDQANVLYGHAGNDVLYGLSDADNLKGDDGNDLLDGGVGADKLEGGLHDDSLIGGAGQDTLDGGAGIDTVIYEGATGIVVNMLVVGENTGDAAGDTFSEIENVTGALGNDTITGNDDANILSGRDGNDGLNGGRGNDTLIGGAGQDTLDGGEGFDFVSYSNATSRIVMNLGNTPASLGDAAGDVLLNIEGIAGSGFDDILVAGSSGSNFEGGGGNDVLHAGAGADTFDGGAGVDTASWSSSASGVVINLANQAGNGGAAFGDTVSNIEQFYLTEFTDYFTAGVSAVNVYGLGGNDAIVGSGQADLLDGGAGNDTLNGGAGADTLNGGSGDDAFHVDSVSDLVIEAAGGGMDTVHSSVNIALSANVEDLVLTGAANQGAGNALANRITGNAGNDTMDGGAGADIIDGGAGFDFVSFATAASGVIASLSGGAGGDAAGDAYSSVEGLIGSDHADTLTGNGGTHLHGGAGNDVYWVSGADLVVEGAGGGADVVYASTSYVLGTASEVESLRTASINSKASLNLTGSATANAITGNAGKNVLSAGGGNDKLWGGLGNDVLYGGAGKDTFVFDTRLNKKTNLDKIVDYVVKDDTIWLDNKYMSKIGKGSALKPGKLNKKFFALDAAKDKDDHVIYNSKNGVVSYDIDGSGSKAAVEIVTLRKGLKMTAAEFFVI